MPAFSILDQVEQGLMPTQVGIQEFSESSAYCNLSLYPGQTTLLKLIFLEEMTGREEDQLSYWMSGGRGGNEIRISPNIRERREFLRDNGYKHFREVQLVGGRRSSKGFITGLAMAKVMWDTLQLGDPGEYYGIDPEKEIFFSCVAGSESQAKEFQYGDFVSRIETCKSFEPYLVKSLETEFRVATAADLRKSAAAKARGSKALQRDIARLRGKALAANAGTLRGSATMAQPLSARIWTPQGWTTMGEIAVGDVITGSDGKSQRVVQLHPMGMQQAYRVYFSDGSSTICNDHHLWTFHQKDRGARTKPLCDFMNDLWKRNGAQTSHAKWRLPDQPVIEGSYQLPSPLHPYLLGTLLGDGSMTGRSIAFYNEDDSVIEAIRQVLPTDHVITNRCGLAWGICTVGRKNLIIRALKEIGVWGHLGPVKFIPEQCLTLSVEDRLALLQGLLDTDGSVSGTSVRFGSSSYDLAQGVIALVRTLGGYATLHVAHRPLARTIRGRLLPPQGDFYEVCISGLNSATLFRSELKRARAQQYSRYQQRHRRLIRIEPVEHCEMQCITVSNADGLYLTDDFVITHNCIAIDEMAHMIPGESKASGSQVYTAAEPSLDQFSLDGMMFLNSSPYTKIGMFYECYEANMRPFDPDAPVSFASILDMDSDEIAVQNGNPRNMTFQYPSWAQPLDSLVLTEYGWKPMGEVTVDDRVMGVDGHPISVLGTRSIECDQVFKVDFSDGQSVRCSGEHLWEITTGSNTKSRVMSTVDIQDRLDKLKTSHHYVPTVRPVQFDMGWDYAIPPYVLGAILGDGCLHANITPNIADFEPGHPVASQVEAELRGDWPELDMSGDQNPGVFSLSMPGYYRNPIQQRFECLGLVGCTHHDKFIPQEYLYGTVQERFALLQGLLDTDGECATKNSVVFYNSSVSLVEGVRQLVESLGGTTKIFWDTRRDQPNARVSMRLPMDLGCPFRMPRKALRWESFGTGRYTPVRKIVKVTRLNEYAAMQCLEVDDPRGLYVTEHCLVTHNCLFEGYRYYTSRWKKKERGKEFGKMVTVSPDWDPTEQDDRGRDLYTVEDRGNILQARAKEAANPETYKVERRGKFAEVTDAYLNPSMVEQMYKGRPGELMENPGTGDIIRRYIPFNTNMGQDAVNLFKYKFHVDPSSTTAGFGFAIAHIEYFPNLTTGIDEEHVVFDLIKRWDPRKMQGKVIRWAPILNEIATLAEMFRPFEITFDQFQSAEPIQQLQERLTARNVSTRVYEKFAPQPLDARVLTPGGWATMGEMAVGQRIIGSDGVAHKVVGVYPQGEQAVYRVTFSDGSSTECTNNHLWRVKSHGERGVEQTLTLREIVDRGLQYGDRGALKWSVRHVRPVQFSTSRSLPIDPYLLGSLLGDGCFHKSVWMATAADDADEQQAIIKPLLPAGIEITRRNHGGWDTLYFKRSAGLENPLCALVRELGLWYIGGRDKFVPEMYLRASIEARVSLLQGLMDTDGHVGRGTYNVSFTTTSWHLAQAVCDLVGSLGGSTTVRTYPYRSTIQVAIKRLPPDINPFRLTRKAEAYRPNQRSGSYRHIKSVELVGVKPTQCIRVDSEDHLYVTDDYILTHNTNETNWKRAEVFKTALYQGLVHAPYDEELNTSPMGAGTFTSKDELKFLQMIPTGGKFPKVEKQDIGPVQTKDMADCIMECVHSLIGNLFMTSLRDRLSSSSVFGGSPGGYSIGGGGRNYPQGGVGPPGISGFYSRRDEKLAQHGNTSSSITRSAIGGRKGGRARAGISPRVGRARGR